MKLFFVNMHKLWGGQSAVVVLLASELKKRGHEVLVAGLAGSELIRRAAAAGLRTFDELELRRGLRLGSFYRDQVRLKKLWAEFRPDGILTNGSQDTWACALARRRCGLDAFLVRWRHNSFEIKAHAFNRWLYGKLIDHVAVSSSEIAPLLTGPGLAGAEKITTFPPSTPLEPFLGARPSGALRAELGLEPGTPLVLSVGRLAPEKGHDTLVRAFRRVAAEIPAATLAIAGHGSQQEKLEALIAELGLGARVRLIGFRNDVPALYADADLAVLAPVAGESFGIALLEAYAAGKACVATDVGGVKDLVVNEVTGFLVPVGDSEAIAEALVRCLKDAALRARLAEAGKARVLEKFTPGKLADVAERLFTALAGVKQKRKT
ncbi:MAG: glycosyltransferase family 4 protein [Planctomycetota bacterium]|nr:glycosyltransferase family 4 protein [Planctomycetota bacterium]